MAGRDPSKEKARILAVVGSYLSQAEHDPTQPLTYDGIATITGVSRTHFAKVDDPDYAALVERILRLRRTRDGRSPHADIPAPVAAPSTQPTMDELRARASAPPIPASLVALPNAELDARIVAEIKNARIVMERWLGLSSKSHGATDAALLACDLEQAIAALRTIHARMKPLAALHEDRLLDDEASEGA